ncbi:Mlo-related protein [Macleaya cordata]|uniref:MLO-like protein n=1 Tax=Macleaya cordata TaxID=56857 RepID=A0A200QL94_MACCD|nr:Mlo-related protein [Macleaya cordata]
MAGGGGEDHDDQVEEYFTRKRRKYLYKALYQIKSELMLFGFMSLLLTVTKEPISKICIPKSTAETFLPCKTTSTAATNVVEEEPSCEKNGKVSLVSREGVNQLQILIFILALFHVLSCLLTFGLGTAKMRRWKSWEEETRTLDYQFSNDPRRFKLTHQTSFAQRHLKFWSDHPLLRWPVCFFRQFNGSVSKTDYFTLRHGFITAHFGEGSTFDFQKFLRRALDEDLQVVVGTRLWIWIFSIFFIFFNAHGFYSYLWLPFIPLVMLLLVGTKLQVIITKMCLESRDSASVVRGTLLVRPHDKFFWFNRPQLLLHLIHFILFQNSFQLAFFTWTSFKFGMRSCFHKETESIVIRIIMGLLVHLLCGYVTLPLYALVTQMGSSMKKEVLTEGVIEVLKSWHTNAKGNKDGRKSYLTGYSPEFSPSQTVETSLSGEQELEMAQFDDSSQGTGHTTVEIMEEEKDYGKTKMRGIYNGENSKLGESN